MGEGRRLDIRYLTNTWDITITIVIVGDMYLIISNHLICGETDIKCNSFIRVINLNVVLSVERETYQLTVLNTDEQRNTRFGGEKMIIL